VNNLPFQVPTFYLNLPPVILWGFFGFLAVLAIYVGAILFYHYKTFSLEPVKSFFLMMLYVLVCGGLLLLSLLGINLYIGSL